MQIQQEKMSTDHDLNSAYLSRLSIVFFNCSIESYEHKTFHDLLG